MITLIAACDKNFGIGYKNQLLCHLPNDLRHFKETTQGHIVCMGSNTFYSIGRSLPNRHNIILSSKDKDSFPNDVFVYNSVEDIVREYNFYSDKKSELFVIGGQSLYEQFIDKADRIILTWIEHEFEKVDTWFPQLNVDWIPTRITRNEADENNPYDHYFITYERQRKNLENNK